MTGVYSRTFGCPRDAEREGENDEEVLMQVRVVPTKVHGAIDYATVPALAVAPKVLHLNGTRSSSLIPRAIATAGSVVAPLTDYELGVKRLIPMRAHLAVDALSGLALAGGPWASGSARQGTRHWLPHALIGAGEIALALTTKTEAPSRARATLPWKPAAAAAAAAAGIAAVAVIAVRKRRSGPASNRP